MTDRCCMDGNEAVARVAYRLNEVIALYPITPATPMGEWADHWRAEGRPNLWGEVPTVVELQSEGGAAGTVHGALQAGALTTTFTASQGLLLMIPNLYRWAGELTPVVVHVASRALAAQGLSIFGDHSDGMACRATGCAILASTSVQEAGDFAAIATCATLNGRVPVLHLFDGFRTSHEIQKVEPIPDGVLEALIPQDAIRAHRHRALTPERPVLRGTAQNPDVYFQGRETVNPFIDALGGHVRGAMERFAALTGRAYAPYVYVGPPDAQRVVVLMGSACETAVATAEVLAAAGEPVGVLKVHLFRPLVASWLVQALPATTRAVAVLDRCKEPGSAGEPLYLDVVVALAEEWGQQHPGAPLPQVVGGRYGLGSKEFTPAMARAVFALLATPSPRNHFTVGIDDDLTHHSLPVDNSFSLEAPDEVRAVFYGLGSDGTVGANKATIQIIGASTPLFAQGYFVYDSKKSGSLTVSHLRFGPHPIRAPYLIARPTLVAVHQWDLLSQVEGLQGMVAGGTLLLNSPYTPADSWRHLPPEIRHRVRELGLQVWQINAHQVAQSAGLGGRINTVMQAAFFAVSGMLPRHEALERMREALRHTYGPKGEAVVRRNLQALDTSLAALQPLVWQDMELQCRGDTHDQVPTPGALPAHLQAAPPFVREVIAPMLAHRGDALPVSALPCDGTWPTGTARWEKRNLASDVPVWESDLCVQCGKCVMVCPHAVIRAKVATPAALETAPEGFREAAARDPAFAGQRFTIQVAVEDCTGCQLCVEVCPARDRQEPKRKALNMAPQRPLREQGRAHWDFFLTLPEVPCQQLNLHKIGQQQLQQPLFEFSGACAGCGETPYLKLLSQLFGDRLLIANATGCSSIYGGNLPTTPWTTNGEGRGPAWSNSLFEDNAEFGYGLRVALDQKRSMALHRLTRPLSPGAEPLPPSLVEALAAAALEQNDASAIVLQRERVAELKRHLRAALERRPAEAQGGTPEAQLLDLADALVKTSVWLVGGDGWAYDIGYGGLDHVLASGCDVNVLVLDTEVYSNTGGQASKATPLGAVAKFASDGKASAKKDLGLMAITQGGVYVASVAMGARDEHTLRAFLEAERYPGPSLILAYSHCIAHGIDMAKGMEQQRLAVASGRWMLYRYDPRRLEQGLSPLQMDGPPPRMPLAEAMATENRFRMLGYSDPQRARQLERQAQAELRRRWALYGALAQVSSSSSSSWANAE
jgi:pyruvate-ferredoxin/flavodoxin oxidoreductase